MAGETLSYSELKNWYTIFNNTIANYGGSLTQKSVPASGSQATPSNINNLFTAINEMAEETYLGTQPSLYSTDYTVVSSGNKILRSSVTPINNTANKLSQIKCRNKISYSCGTNSCGNKSNGENSDGTWGNASCSKGTCSNGSKGCGSCFQGSYTRIAYNSGSNSNGSNTNGYNSHSTRSNGTHGNGANNNTIKTNGSTIDILNANTSY